MAEKNTKPVKVEEVVSEDIGGAKAAAPPKGGGSGSLIVVIVGLLVMLITPLVCYFIVKQTLPGTVKAEGEAEGEAGGGHGGGHGEKKPASGTLPVFVMEPMIVNIAETKGTRILRIVPHLVLSEAELVEKMTLFKPMLVDEITTVASSKTIDELDGMKGRENLKKDIISRVNTRLEKKMSGAVVDVYFVEFLIQ